MEFDSIATEGLEQEQTRQSIESVQEVSKRNPRLPKSDVRYWQQSIFRPSYGPKGKRRQVGHWAVKIQFAGRRETISLGTANKIAAAVKARDVHNTVHSSGWDTTLLKYKPKSRWTNSAVSTVGEFLDAVGSVWSGNRRTVRDYGRAFRKIVGDIFEIDGDREKFDYRAGGRDAWVARIDHTKLRDITPDRVQRWKVDFLKRAGTDPVKKRAASISVNSFIRQAKSLFSPAVVKFIKFDIPSSPFEGVAFEPRRSMRYQTSFNVKEVIRAAQDDLPPQQFKIFLLAMMAGLRRNEIDKLMWIAFDWERGIISLKATAYFSPKSEDSIGDVEVDPEVMELFRGYFASSKGDFVIESSVVARPDATYSHYRCQKLFRQLAQWLRKRGVTGNRPLHTLRKEYGSQVCAKHGIYAASLALRHADIAITSQHYLDKRQRMTVGLGALLSRPTNVMPFRSGKSFSATQVKNRRR